MFRVGEKIVCINNSQCDYLELNSIYIVLLSDETGSLLRFNTNFIHKGLWFSNHRFITLKEHRKNKINKIESCSK